MVILLPAPGSEGGSEHERGLSFDRRAASMGQMASMQDAAYLLQCEEEDVRFLVQSGHLANRGMDSNFIFRVEDLREVYVKDTARRCDSVIDAEFEEKPKVTKSPDTSEQTFNAKVKGQVDQTREQVSGVAGDKPGSTVEDPPDSKPKYPPILVDALTKRVKAAGFGGKRSFDINDVAEVLQCSLSDANTLVMDGKLKGSDSKGTWKCTKNDLLAYLHANPEAQKTAFHEAPAPVNPQPAAPDAATTKPVDADDVVKILKEGDELNTLNGQFKRDWAAYRLYLQKPEVELAAELDEALKGRSDLSDPRAKMIDQHFRNAIRDCTEICGNAFEPISLQEAHHVFHDLRAHADEPETEKYRVELKQFLDSVDQAMKDVVDFLNASRSTVPDIVPPTDVPEDHELGRLVYAQREQLESQASRIFAACQRDGSAAAEGLRQVFHDEETFNIPARDMLKLFCTNSRNVAALFGNDLHPDTIDHVRGIADLLEHVAQASDNADTQSNLQDYVEEVRRQIEAFSDLAHEDHGHGHASHGASATEGNVVGRTIRASRKVFEKQGTAAKTVMGNVRAVAGGAVGAGVEGSLLGLEAVQSALSLGGTAFTNIFIPGIGLVAVPAAVHGGRYLTCKFLHEKKLNQAFDAMSAQLATVVKDAPPHGHLTPAQVADFQKRLIEMRHDVVSHGKHKGLVDTKQEKDFIDFIAHHAHCSPEEVPFFNTDEQYTQHCFVRFTEACDHMAKDLGLYDPKTQELVKFFHIKKDDLEHPDEPGKMSVVKHLMEVSYEYGRLIAYQHRKDREKQLTGQVVGGAVMASTVVGPVMPAILGGGYIFAMSRYIESTKPKSIEFDDHGHVRLSLQGLKHMTGGLHSRELVNSVNAKTELKGPQEHWAEKIGLFPHDLAHGRTIKSAEDVSALWQDAALDNLVNEKRPAPVVDEAAVTRAEKTKKDKENAFEKAKEALTKLEDKKRPLEELQTNLVLLQGCYGERERLETLPEAQDRATQLRNERELTSMTDQIRNLQVTVKIFSPAAVIAKIGTNEAEIERLKGLISTQEGVKNGLELEVRTATSALEALQNPLPGIDPLTAPEILRDPDIRRAFAVCCHREFEKLHAHDELTFWQKLQNPFKTKGMQSAAAKAVEIAWINSLTTGVGTALGFVGPLTGMISPVTGAIGGFIAGTWFNWKEIRDIMKRKSGGGGGHAHEAPHAPDHKAEHKEEHHDKPH